MEIENSPLWTEIVNVLKSDSAPGSVVTATIHAPSADLDYQCYRVMELDVQCDFIANFTDYVVVRVIIPLGDYAHYIYPNRDNLELTVTKATQRGTYSDGSSIRVKRYKAFMIDNENAHMNTSAKTAPSRNDLNQKGFIGVKFQLMDVLAYHLRATQVGGIYRNSKTGDVVKALMTNESQRALMDMKLTLQGVDMVPPNNNAVRDHIIVRQGTRLIDLPAYIQDEAGGLYTAGLGYYLYNGYWYIYPAYDTERIKKTKSITIINVPSGRMPTIDKTFMRNGNSITVLATGDVKYKDDRKAVQQNNGNGVRYTNPEKVMGGLYRVSGNKAVTQQNEHTNEFIVDKSKDSWSLAPIAAERFTANDYKMLSSIAMRRGAFMTLRWDHSDPELVTPGMLAKIYYISNGSVRSLDGVIAAAHHFTCATGKGLSPTLHSTTSALTFFSLGYGG